MNNQITPKATPSHLKLPHWVWLIVFLSLLTSLHTPLPAAGQVEALYKIDLPTPVNSGAYGKQVAILPNGNIVVADPAYSTASVTNVGAVYLYDGETLGLISVLTGSHINDFVGGSGSDTGGITVLSSGDFVVSSPAWDGTRGAVTQVNGTTGLSGVVSSVNSLIGSYDCDTVGQGGITELPNGNYLVYSPLWGGGPECPGWQGAVTWVDRVTGATGEVGAGNSLIEVRHYWK